MNLEERVKALEDLVQAITRCLIAEPQKPKPQPQMALADVGDIALQFPEDLRRHLTITVDTIKTKFVAREKWLEMDKIATDLGYKYVSAGKESRWEK